MRTPPRHLALAAGAAPAEGEGSLVARLLAGNRCDFDAFCDLYGARYLAWSRRRTASEAEARRLAEAMLVRLVDQLPRWDGRQPLAVRALGVANSFTKGLEDPAA